MFANKDAQATVAVKSLDAARPFYEGVLGLQPDEESEKGVQGYRAGKTTLLVYESSFAGSNKATVVTWALGQDFDGVVDALRAKGAKFERYDLPGGTFEDGVHHFGKMKVVWFKDPDGNILSAGNYAA
jgi:catechol 2,3-dioxygenase-like lactoylglutathione lyase family enzyme